MCVGEQRRKWHWSLVQRQLALSVAEFVRSRTKGRQSLADLLLSFLETRLKQCELFLHEGVNEVSA